MDTSLYGELTPWYTLLDPTEDHADEVALFKAAIERWMSPTDRRASLLELGAGAGNNAFHLRGAFECTLTDLAEPMLDLSRALNPECEHVVGDMRDLALGRTFDVVLAHDALVYMHTEDDLDAVARTAAAHTREGGVVLFVPDCTRESFVEASCLQSGESGSRAMRCLEWTYDPDPTDTTYTVDYAFLLKDGPEVRAVHDRHVEGLFSEAVWTRVLERAGFRVERGRREVEGSTPYTPTFFVGVKL